MNLTQFKDNLAVCWLPRGRFTSDGRPFTSLGKRQSCVECSDLPQFSHELVLTGISLERMSGTSNSCGMKGMTTCFSHDRGELDS
jgi:hypothetical protein